MASSMLSSAAVASISRATPAQATMVAPFTGLKSNAAFPVTRKLNNDAKVNNLHWLSGLSSLKYLDMGTVDLNHAAFDWLQAINRLSSLLELKLEYCGLNLHPSFGFVNLTSLEVLELRGNYFESSIPRTLGSLCKLQILDLSSTGISGTITEFMDGLSRCTENNLEKLRMDYNNLFGTIPSSLGQLKLLKSVILNQNSFSGSIPVSIGNLSSLELLDLSFNQMNGTIPESIGQLSQLNSLDISFNYWNCVITEAHFLNLTSLKEIQMGSLDGPMTLSFQVKDDWVPHFSLQTIVVRRAHLGTKFPAWLQTHNELYDVSLREVGISGTIPDWLWKFPKISFLDLSDNQISGKLPASFDFSADEVYIYLSGNKLEGPIPAWSTLSDLFIDLGNNSLSGPIPQNLWELMPRLKSLDLSENNLNGTIPCSMGKLKNLTDIILSNNQLSGELPQDWMGMHALIMIDLSYNSLSGHIPSSMGFVSSLRWLILSNNNFDGEFPSTFQNCSSLLTLDVGGNRISGKLPTWIGGSLSSLAIVRLRSNLLTGDIPHQLCLLPYLHILDLADNNLSGLIPHCLRNLTGMVSFPQVGQYVGEETPLVVKGIQRTYSGQSLSYGKFLDLSKNNLQGEIPVEITSLLGLIWMNLSMNQLSGKIPYKIGGMKNLESLDLSRNQLSGPIPQTMSSLTFLSYLNLSYNNLSGRIPSGNQLRTLNNSSVYMGNPFLCGHPLETRCAGEETDQDQSSTGVSGGENENDDNGFEIEGFYRSMVVGFVVGLWGVCGIFFIKKSWRHAYFRFVEDLVERLLLTVALNVARLKRKMASVRNERGH